MFHVSPTSIMENHVENDVESRDSWEYRGFGFSPYPKRNPRLYVKGHVAF